jgi:hypothetical protein
MSISAIPDGRGRTEEVDVFGALICLIQHPEEFEVCEANGELFVRPRILGRQEQQQMAYQREPGSSHDHDLSRAAMKQSMWSPLSTAIAIGLLLAVGALVVGSLAWNDQNNGPATRSAPAHATR